MDQGLGVREVISIPVSKKGGRTGTDPGRAQYKYYGNVVGMLERAVGHKLRLKLG